MHPHEETRFRQHVQRTPPNKEYCFKFQCHAGCAKGNACTYAHQKLDVKAGIDYTYHLKAAKWGGLKENAQGRPTKTTGSRS